MDSDSISCIRFFEKFDKLMISRPVTEIMHFEIETWKLLNFNLVIRCLFPRFKSWKFRNFWKFSSPLLIQPLVKSYSQIMRADIDQIIWFFPFSIIEFGPGIAGRRWAPEEGGPSPSHEPCFGLFNSVSWNPNFGLRVINFSIWVTLYQNYYQFFRQMQSFILGRSFIPFSFHPSVYFLEFSSCKAWWRHKPKILETPTVVIQSASVRTRRATPKRFLSQI